MLVALSVYRACTFRRANLNAIDISKTRGDGGGMGWGVCWRALCFAICRPVFGCGVTVFHCRIGFGDGGAPCAKIIAPTNERHFAIGGNWHIWL